MKIKLAITHSVPRFRQAFILCSVLCFFTACSTQYSSAQILAEDTYVVYKDTYKAYAETEERYMNVLFNLERMPEEDELWMQKRELMIELEHLRTLMLQSRGELDDAVRAWDSSLQQKLADIKKAETFKSPNLKGYDARRSSPGELLQSEADQIKQNR